MTSNSGGTASDQSGRNSGGQYSAFVEASGIAGQDESLQKAQETLKQYETTVNNLRTAMEGLNGAFQMGEGAMGSMDGDLAKAAENYENARAGAEKLAGAIPGIGKAVQAMLPLTFDLGEKMFGSLPELQKEIEGMDAANSAKAQAAGKARGDFDNSMGQLQAMAKSVSDAMAMQKMSPAERGQAMLSQEVDQSNALVDKMFAEGRHQLMEDKHQAESPVIAAENAIGTELSTTPAMSHKKGGKPVEDPHHAKLREAKDGADAQLSGIEAKFAAQLKELTKAHDAAVAINEKQRHSGVGNILPSRAADLNSGSGSPSSAAFDRTADAVGRIYAVLQTIEAQLAAFLKHPTSPVVS